LYAGIVPHIDAVGELRAGFHGSAFERRYLELGFIEEGELDLLSEVVDVGRSRGEGLDAGAADGARASIALATRLRFAAGSVAR
jgi:hypothetical protein